MSQFQTPEAHLLGCTWLWEDIYTEMMTLCLCKGENKLRQNQNTEISVEYLYHCLSLIYNYTLTNHLK